MILTKYKMCYLQTINFSVYSLFPGGSKPNLADLAVFGVLRPIRYLKSGKDMVEHTHIGEWYSRMENAVGESAGIRE